MSFKVPRGTQDILPGQSEKWQKVEAVIRDICRVYRYNEIRTPIFEQQIYLHVVSVKQRMLYKRKCIHLKIAVVVR